MGLPQIDFRVPESTWVKAALERLRTVPGLNNLPTLGSTGAVAWPYKIAVVAVMALVACGTLVTFGSAGAETPAASAQTAALPGSDEASPTVEGRVLPPPSPSLLNAQDLLSTLNLTDYSPDDDTTTLTLNDEDDEDTDENTDEDTASDIRKKLAAAAKAKPKPTSGTKSPSPAPTTDGPSPTPTKTTAPPEPEEVEGPKHKAWADKMDDYEECVDNAKNDLAKGLCNFKNPGAEPDFES